MMDLNEYLNLVRQERNDNFPSPYEVTYDCFNELGYANQPPDFFIDNASMIVESLRTNCWERFLRLESEFTANRLTDLIDENETNGMSPIEAIEYFAVNYTDHFYQLCLSNTQSRRSRAGKEFEAILELIFMGAGIPLDSQGIIGKQFFTERGLSKLVDVVSPGAIEYVIEKNDTVLISAKTTLRERWQEVPEEMSRTGASLMFLATLDENILNEVQNTLYESNIRITTTKNNKQLNYNNNRRIVSFEDLIHICLQKKASWEGYQYDFDALSKRRESIDKQRQKHGNHEFVLQYYRNWIEWLENGNPPIE